ncbi:569_t:CDS:1, partial [Acaulospora colombiana]
DAAVLEYEFASPKAAHMSPKNSGPQSQTGSGIRSAIDTFLGSTRSQTSTGGGGGSFVHALTTDTPQLAYPQPSEWGRRPKGGMSRQEKHLSTQTQGSTLEADNVLEGMMNSSATPDYSTTSHTNMFGTHPFSAPSAHR